MEGVGRGSFKSMTTSTSTTLELWNEVKTVPFILLWTRNLYTILTGVPKIPVPNPPPSKNDHTAER